MITDDFQLVAGKVLQSSSNAYTILEFVGEGSYGKVAKCQIYDSEQVVAVKILKQEIEEDVENELFMLEVIGLMNADRVNVVKLYESFLLCGHTCLVFEMLDMDLFQQCLKNGSLYVNAIRSIAKQLLETLQALQSLGIIHADIKPDNVMLVNMEDLPYRVKLIDFGMAQRSYTTRCGDVRQAIRYRAPEVILGLPYTEAIDMWGLGCLLAFLYQGFHLFPFHCEHLMMRCLVDILGMPSHHHLQKGAYTRYFFCEEGDESGSTWRLLTKNEYSAINKTKAKKWPKDLNHFTSLDDLVSEFEEEEGEKKEDREAFIDLLKKMLHLDGEKRISPIEALQHPFITMSHLSQDPGCRDYLTEAQTYMSICPLESSPNGSTPTPTLPPGNMKEASVKEDWNKELQLSSSTDKDLECLSETEDLILSFSQMCELYK